MSDLANLLQQAEDALDDAAQNLGKAVELAKSVGVRPIEIADHLRLNGMLAVFADYWLEMVTLDEADPHVRPESAEGTA